MKRSGFRLKRSYTWKRKPLLRGQPLNKVGRRTKRWASVWAWLKPRLEAAGRDHCEFNFIPHECWGRLDPCHSRKRREMENEDIYIVAIGCAQIHRVLDEVMSHAEMEKAVWRAIDAAGGAILPERKAA